MTLWYVISPKSVICTQHAQFTFKIMHILHAFQYHVGLRVKVLRLLVVKNVRRLSYSELLCMLQILSTAEIFSSLL